MEKGAPSPREPPVEHMADGTNHDRAPQHSCNGNTNNEKEKRNKLPPLVRGGRQRGQRTEMASSSAMSARARTPARDTNKSNKKRDAKHAQHKRQPVATATAHRPDIAPFPSSLPSPRSPARLVS